MNNYFNSLSRNDDEKLLIARLMELIQKAANGTCGQSDFLDLRQQDLARAVAVNGSAIDWQLNGGYEEAERKRLIIYPEWWSEIDTKISYLKIIHKDHNEQFISHRDYLGAAMNLGIKREKIGDIVVQKTHAFMIVDVEVADYIVQQFLRVKNSKVQVEIVPQHQFVFEPPELKSLQTTLASLRLDAVVAAAFNKSRSEANSVIESGMVRLNHMEIYKCSAPVKPEDLISVRGWGRFRLEEIGNLSRKGRYHVRISHW